jgi:hypothetical protein
MHSFAQVPQLFHEILNGMALEHDPHDPAHKRLDTIALHKGLEKKNLSQRDT